jgi:hypothetical protein
MTRSTNARIAGFAFLFYIAAGILSMVLASRRTGGDSIAEKLAGIATHATDVRIAFILSLLTAFSALVLAVTLWAITREEDPDLAMMAMVCRVAEGIIGIFIPVTLALLWLATSTGPSAPDTPAAQALAAFLLKVGGWKTLTSATFFAVGSALTCWLFLRGRMIPIPLAWLGLVASVALVAALPLQLAGFLHGPITSLIWIPMAAFEIPLGLWLLIKGVTP